MLQFLQTLHIHSRKEGLMNPKKKVSCMETVGGLKYVEDGYVVHGTFLLKLLSTHIGKNSWKIFELWRLRKLGDDLNSEVDALRRALMRLNKNQ